MKRRWGGEVNSWRTFLLLMLLLSLMLLVLKRWCLKCWCYRPPKRGKKESKSRISFSSNIIIISSRGDKTKKWTTRCQVMQQIDRNSQVRFERSEEKTATEAEDEIVSHHHITFGISIFCHFLPACCMDMYSRWEKTTECEMMMMMMMMFWWHEKAMIDLCALLSTVTMMNVLQIMLTVLYERKICLFSLFLPWCPELMWRDNVRTRFVTLHWIILLIWLVYTQYDYRQFQSFHIISECVFR